MKFGPRAWAPLEDRLSASHTHRFRSEFANVTSFRCSEKPVDRRLGLASFTAASNSAGPSARFIAPAPHRLTFGCEASLILSRLAMGLLISLRRITCRRRTRTAAALFHASSTSRTPVSPMIRIQWLWGAIMLQVKRATKPELKKKSRKNNPARSGVHHRAC